MSFKFWSDKEIKIVKNYTAKEILKHNLLPGRTATMIGAQRSNLVRDGVKVFKNKYEPINSTLKDNRKIKFFDPSEDKIILDNLGDIQKALSLLPGRTLSSVYARRSYLKNNPDNRNKITKFPIEELVDKTVSTGKDLNLTINDIKLSVNNVKAIYIDKNNIDIKTH